MERNVASDRPIVRLESRPDADMSAAALLAWLVETGIIPADRIAVMPPAFRDALKQS